MQWPFYAGCGQRIGANVIEFFNSTASHVYLRIWHDFMFLLQFSGLDPLRCENWNPLYETEWRWRTFQSSNTSFFRLQNSRSLWACGRCSTKRWWYEWWWMLWSVVTSAEETGFVCSAGFFSFIIIIFLNFIFFASTTRNQLVGCKISLFYIIFCRIKISIVFRVLLWTTNKIYATHTHISIIRQSF